MKTKSSVECGKALEHIMKTSKEKPLNIMSDNDKAFLGSAFEEVLEKNNIMLNTNIINDHHALGIIDNFAKRIKTTLSKIFLKTKTTIWINSLESIITLYNNTEHSSINDLTPNEVKDNQNDILDINIIKNQKNKVVSDLEINDKVRIRLSSGFKKGTEPRWSDVIYTVIKVNGATIKLDNDTRYKRNDLLQVPKNTVSTEVNVIIKRNINNKIKKKST
jgi:hypothetical protein